MCWGIATACARAIASSNKQVSLCNEQNCLGIISPASVVVISRSLVHSPAARTTAHVFATLRIVKPSLECLSEFKTGRQYADPDTDAYISRIATLCRTLLAPDGGASA